MLLKEGMRMDILHQLASKLFAFYTMPGFPDLRYTENSMEPASFIRFAISDMPAAGKDLININFSSPQFFKTQFFVAVNDMHGLRSTWYAALDYTDNQSWGIDFLFNCQTAQVAKQFKSDLRLSDGWESKWEN